MDYSNQAFSKQNAALRKTGYSKDVGFTPEREQKQMDLYRMEFNVYREYKDVITGVTFWNVSDRRSWRDSRGRGPQGKVYPLLFDENLKPKKAFGEVVKFN